MVVESHGVKWGVCLAPRFWMTKEHVRLVQDSCNGVRGELTGVICGVSQVKGRKVFVECCEVCGDKEMRACGWMWREAVWGWEMR